MVNNLQGHYRAAIIGHTGRGDFGHGLDIAFVGLPMIEIVAVADPVEDGRLRAQRTSGATTAYADYREMLRSERPELVAIGPRFLGERVAMVEAAAAAGAHIFLEKPFAATLVEADAMLAACASAKVKIAVAHQGRLHPATLYALHLVREGAIGRLRLVRGYGKMDSRGGGQDLMILGTHVLDLMRLFAGDAIWASGELLAGARPAEPDDLRPGDEEIGVIAGDGLRATYGFPNGVIGLFESFAGLGQGEELFGVELVGDEGQLSLRGGFTKRLLRYPRPFIQPGAAHDRWEWVDVPDARPGDVPGAEMPRLAELMQRGNQRLVLDLLAAVEEDRAPAASGERARAALELIHAVALSHWSSGRVRFPLTQRNHPYSMLS